MASYHVYFSSKEGIAADDLVEQVHEFMKTQIRDNFATAYRLLQMHEKATFPDLPDYHLIVDYQSEEDLKNAFQHMKSRFRDEPHSPLMTMVSDFKVAFSYDEESTSPSESA